MKLVLFQLRSEDSDGVVYPEILSDDGIVDVSEAVATLAAGSPQQLMEGIISNFDGLKADLERLSTAATKIAPSNVRLRPPLPRPGKILCCIGNYWEHAQREARPLNMFLKNSDAVIGPGDTVVLPKFTEPYVFHHEAELAIVIRGPVKEVS